MTWAQLKAHRDRLGLTEKQMAKLVLGCGESTYNGWGTRSKVPPYATASVENFLSNTIDKKLMLMDMRARAAGAKAASEWSGARDRWLMDMREKEVGGE